VPAEEILTLRQVADEMKVHYETVRGWVQSGELVAIDIGRGYRISRADLEDFKRRRRTDQRKHGEEEQG
jgi:excisionase family DNA binding protein